MIARSTGFIALLNILIRLYRITHAAIVENNNTKPESTIEEKDCNKTEITETIKQSPDLILLQAQNTDTSANDKTNNTTIVSWVGNTTNNNEANQTDSIITDKDTVLKYVYKKGEKGETDKKNKGHVKNSLRRRKRSSDDPRSPLPSKFQNAAVIVNYETSHEPTANWSPSPNAANIINKANLADFKIETQHNNLEINNKASIDRPQKKDSSENINHNESSYESTERGEDKQNDSRENSSKESQESGDRRDFKNNQNFASNYHNQNSDESNENDHRNNLKYTSANGIENDSSENNEYSKHEGKDIDSREREKIENSSNEKSQEDSREINETYERNPKHYESRHQDGPEQNKENYSKDILDNSRENSSENSNGRLTYRTKPYNSRNVDSPKENLESSNENSSESDHKTYIQDIKPYTPGDKQSYRKDDKESSNESGSDSSEIQKHVLINLDHNKSNLPIQDVDIGDFNHERINVNENGKKIAAKNNHENFDHNSAVEILPSNALTPNSKSDNILQLVTNIHAPLKNYANKLIEINDGEVRPVVEIHAEQEDDSSEEDTKTNSKNSESLEAILDGKDPQEIRDNNQNGKIITNTEEEKGDVKQQFERIPLNYKHNQNNEQKNTQNNDPPEKDSSIVEDDRLKDDAVVTKLDGTIDVFAPVDVQYDDKLNIKFDDIQIKLPEIRLPEDILAFTKSYSPYKDDDNNEENKKPQYYNDDSRKRNLDKNDHSDDDDNRDHKKDDEPVTDYYGYYGEDNKKNQEYKNKKETDDEEDENDHDEDLYEKFVRERFGKRGSFGKRSEKLEQRPLNPHLSKTIQNILHKTATIDEQAKKSGDPNAGYMWTLEYGENL